MFNDAYQPEEQAVANPGKCLEQGCAYPPPDVDPGKQRSTSAPQYLLLKPQQEQATEPVTTLMEQVEPALSAIIAPDRHLNNDGAIALPPGDEL